MLCTCKADDWYGIDTCCEPRKIIQCPHCRTTIHYDDKCWYCALHPPPKLEWIAPIPKNVSVVRNVKRCANGNMNAWDVVACGYLHPRRRTLERGANTHYLQRSKYYIKHHLKKEQLESFDLIEGDKRTVVMRIRHIETIWYRFHQRKLITLAFILSKIFTRKWLPEQAQQCAPTAQKTLIMYEQLWNTIEDLIQGW